MVLVQLASSFLVFIVIGIDDPVVDQCIYDLHHIVLTVIVRQSCVHSGTDGVDNGHNAGHRLLGVIDVTERSLTYVRGRFTRIVLPFAGFPVPCPADNVEKRDVTIFFMHGKFPVLETAGDLAMVMDRDGSTHFWASSGCCGRGKGARETGQS